MFIDIELMEEKEIIIYLNYIVLHLVKQFMINCLCLQKFNIRSYLTHFKNIYWQSAY